MSAGDRCARYDGQLPVAIVRWVENYQPGIVEISLLDRFGHDWRLTEKVPMVTNADLDEGSSYPQPGYVACRILTKGIDAGGRAVAIVEIDFAGDQPDTFEVFADRIEPLTENGGA